MSKIDKNTLKVMNIIRGKIGLKDVCKLETDEERQVVWDAIDKQTPQKPIVRNYKDWSGCKCGMKIYEEFRYCPYCGQLW